ncbi:MAG: class I SAM-dependent methyltransferase [Patescibacteria group bacterium]|jgi:ubiquinone/menaquinone biosynthesis C-methylase UbiE
MSDPKPHEHRRIRGELSRWGEAEAKRYEAAKHGPDGRRFLDNNLYEVLDEAAIKDKVVADIGAGAGPWSEYAIKLGASHVTCLDLNPAMIARAREKWGEAGPPTNIDFVVANVANLPLDNDSQDVVMSINVGCNLPEVGDVFNKHFNEAYRVAKPGAMLVVTAPDSLNTVFTDGNEPNGESVQSEIDQLWERETDHTVGGAKKILSTLVHILRATFILDKTGKPIVITDKNSQLVKSGDPILRKIPGLVVDNNYHTAAEYRQAAQAAGWEIVSESNESFADETERTTHNEAGSTNKLGKEYIEHPPFIMLKLTKQQ